MDSKLILSPYVQKQLCLVSIVILSAALFSWGFVAHRNITQMAVYTLPSSMVPFYKQNMDLLVEASVQPDIRRYAVAEEAPNHYIDIDSYGDSAVNNFPKTWQKAVAMYPEDTLMKYGILPYAIQKTKYLLTRAMKEKNGALIIRYSSDLSHYIADAHVPLHTTYNYNGQFSGQHGIHALWESRIPELEIKSYSFWVGKASYINNPPEKIWETIRASHLHVRDVLSLEKTAGLEFPPDKKYAFEQRGKYEKRVYSKEYAKFYSNKMDGLVEKQMQKAIKMVGDFWLTCWINAGQPDLDNIMIKKSNGKTQLPKDSILRFRERALLHHK